MHSKRVFASLEERNLQREGVRRREEMSSSGETHAFACSPVTRKESESTERQRESGGERKTAEAELPFQVGFAYTCLSIIEVPVQDTSP